jgi:hypothetical protein
MEHMSRRQILGVATAGAVAVATVVPAGAAADDELQAPKLSVQGNFVPGGGQCDAELRAWVLSRLLWNPDGDTDALVTEWMQGVYGAAWKPMRA